MSRASEFRLKYGVLGAGAVSRSIIGQLPAKAREIGPVAAVSFRVASRTANSLRAGYAVRNAGELDAAPAILFHAPPDHAAALLELLEAAAIRWPGKALIACDCDLDRAFAARLEGRGASIAIARQFGLAGQIAVEGSGRGQSIANRIARALHLRVIEINRGAADVFDAAVTLSAAALTPLVDTAAAFLRQAGVRETEAPRLAALLFEQTLRAYAHSGKQSWEWYMKKPATGRIEAEIAAAGPHTGPLLRHVLLYALEWFGKHPEAAAALRVACTGQVFTAPE